MLGLEEENIIDDESMLQEMSNLIFLNDDIRPVWVGPGLGNTNVSGYKKFANWANEHWALYYGFHKMLTKDNANILDIGCGSGFCTRNLSRLVDDGKIIGYDIDKTVIDFAIKYNINNNVCYHTTNVITNELPKKQDYIFMVEILEHIKHVHHNNLIDRCIESLSGDGLLFICTPKEENYEMNKERGHVGIMTTPHFNEFVKHYSTNIVSIEFFDNKNLTTGNDYISKHDGSHYKITMNGGAK